MTATAPLTHVVYVDDEPDMRMLVQTTLENIGGIRVTLCENGIDTLEAALDQQPQMIILDVMMRDMDGPAILAELKSDPRVSRIPVIFLTAKTEGALLDDYRRMGAAGVITKPFDLMGLPTQVRALWEQSHA
jgi:CheY-like chemotaxis protein